MVTIVFDDGHTASALPDPAAATPEPSGDPRPLSETEHQVLNALLAHELENVEDLRRQAEFVLAVPTCACGCGSIGFVHPEGHRPSHAVRARPAPVEGTITDTAGEPLGGVILFLRNGKLDDLEVWSLAMPEAGSIRWERLVG